MRLNRQVRLYPNKTMKRVLDSLCDYRRYCWNEAVACWNRQYEARLIGLPEDLRNKLRSKIEHLSDDEKDLVNQYPNPSHYSVRDELVACKEDWQYAFSSRVLQQAVKDLATAWEFSLFGQFRQMMEYKSQKFGKTLIIADRFYPSTQRCSSCGFVKTGDDKITLNGNIKHGTRHNEYICYRCGYKDDRDHNAVLNLLALAE